MRHSLICEVKLANAVIFFFRFKIGFVLLICCSLWESNHCQYVSMWNLMSPTFDLQYLLSRSQSCLRRKQKNACTRAQWPLLEFCQHQMKPLLRNQHKAALSTCNFTGLTVLDCSEKTNCSFPGVERLLMLLIWRIGSVNGSVSGDSTRVSANSAKKQTKSEQRLRSENCK